MSWHNPTLYELRPTGDSESFRHMPGGVTGLPIDSHPGAFGTRRAHHTHEGVDIYLPEGAPVLAVEEGVVVKVVPFTGPLAGLPWWRDTTAVFVEGASGVVVYGEIQAKVREGDQVKPGALLGWVERVLVKDKGRPMSMLHLELHAAGSRVAPEWLVHDARPEVLRDPTPFLMECLAAPKLSATGYNPMMYCNPHIIAAKVLDLLPR